MCYGGCDCAQCMGFDYDTPCVKDAPQNKGNKLVMELLDSTGYQILLGDIVKFKSTVTGQIRRGEVVRMSQSQHRHWSTKVIKIVVSIRVHYANEWGMTCSVFHNSTNLTVVKRPA